MLPASPSRFATLLLAALALTPAMHAGGPRFITGTNFSGIGPGNAMAFYTPNLTYATDPGNLATNVTHAQADTLVAPS